jgi:maleate cis-trans isomerase
MSCAGETFAGALRDMAGVPVITAAEASTAAIRALGASSLAVATPYGESGNRIIADYLASLGVSVAAMAGLGFDRTPALWRENAPGFSAERLLDFALSVDVPSAGALYLPCTGMGSLETIAMFEGRTGKPAFSSVQAGYWASLRRLGVDGRQGGNGRLLEIWDF